MQVKVLSMRNVGLSVDLSVCPPLFSKVLRRTTVKFGERVRLGPGKTKFECVDGAISGRGHPRSNPYSLSYGSETWWVESSSDAENVDSQFNVT